MNITDLWGIAAGGRIVHAWVERDQERQEKGFGRRYSTLCGKKMTLRRGVYFGDVKKCPVCVAANAFKAK